MEKQPKSTNKPTNSEITKPLRDARNQVNKIVKNLNRNDLDWTVQFSISSTEPNKVKYCAMIESPANGLQPITWVCDTYDDLLSQLKVSAKGLDTEAVERAWHEGEIARAEALINYHKEALGLSEES